MSGERYSILVVENDAPDARRTGELLGQIFPDGLNLRCVKQLSEALAALATETADVILIDMAQPDDLGWTPLQRLHDAAPDAALIVLTMGGDLKRGVEAIRQGAQDFLPKGQTGPDALESAVRHAVERKRFDSERKHHQEKLQFLVDEATRDLLNTNEQLQREIHERKAAEDQLRQALTRLEAYSEAKSQFVSNVSHELKTPLASISHAVENLLAGVVGDVPPRVLAYLRMMQDDCRRLRSTVNDILDTTSIEANQLVLRRVKLNLPRFVELTLRSLRIQAEEKRQQLEVQSDGGAWFVACDPPKLDRILLNVAANAIKYSPPGARIDIRIHGDAEQGEAVVECEDNGVGIPTVHLPNIGQRYYRVGEHADGTGLGLSLAKDLARLHGGGLELISPPPNRDTGTLVSVRLPLEAPPRVLAVEDEPIVRAVLTAQLRKAGYQTLECASAEAAVALLHQMPRPELMVVDLHLPGMNGIELIAWIKSEPELRYLPMLLVTGRALTPEQGQLIQDFGVTALAKPWQWRELIDRLEEVALSKHYLNY